MDSIKYCNEVMARIETLMYQELSGMAHWKCEFVGTDFIRSKDIKGNNVSEIVESCVKEMKAAGIVSDVTYKTSPDGLMLKLKVKDCIHHLKEVLVAEEGVDPYICPIANMVLDQIHEKLKYTTSYKAKQSIDGENKAVPRLYGSLQNRRSDRSGVGLAQRRRGQGMAGEPAFADPCRC